MKYICSVFGLILWMVFMLILVASIVGFVLIAMMQEDDGIMNIPNKFLTVFEK